jgi:group I intron endonuclease
MIIYKATNLINGKIYIGKTIKALARRRTEHICEAKSPHYQSVLHAAIVKYGAENFRWEIVDRCLFSESLDALEIHYIEKFNSMIPHGYNLTAGGGGANGYTHTRERKQKISKALKGRERSAEHCANISKSKTGKKLSEDHKKKISLGGMGKRRKPFTSEHKRNIGLKSLGRIPSATTRKKQSDKLKGRPFTNEHKQKISEALTRFYLSRNKGGIE